MADAPVQGQTGWRRFAALAVPATGLAGVLTVMMANGAVAASFAVSGQNFKVSASELNGQGFAQFGTVDVGKDGAKHPVAVSAIRSATLTNMCQSVLVPTPFGKVTVRITAGGSDPVEARNLVVDTDDLAGDATFTNIEIGRDASTLDKVPGAKGQPGLFGQQADSVHIERLRQNAWATTAGTFKLKNLHMTVKFGENECF